MAGVVLGDTPTVRAIHSDVTACTSGDKARRAKGKGGGVGVWSSSELGDLKETKAGEKKKEMNKKVIKENTKQLSKRRKSECGEEQICDQAWYVNSPQTVHRTGEHPAHSYSSHGVHSAPALLTPFSSLRQNPKHKTSCGRPWTSYRMPKVPQGAAEAPTHGGSTQHLTRLAAAAGAPAAHTADPGSIHRCNGF